MTAADARFQDLAEDASPIPSAHAAEGSAVGWAATAMATATVFLLIFNAASLKSWADGLEPGPATVAVRGAAVAWAARMQALGLSGPRDALHAGWKRAVSVRMDGTPEGDR
jgi:hypothetical protein